MTGNEASNVLGYIEGVPIYHCDQYTYDNLPLIRELCATYLGVSDFDYADPHAGESFRVE